MQLGSSDRRRHPRSLQLAKTNEACIPDPPLARKESVFSTQTHKDLLLASDKIEVWIAVHRENIALLILSSMPRFAVEWRNGRFLKSAIALLTFHP